MTPSHRRATPKPATSIVGRILWIAGRHVRAAEARALTAGVLADIGVSRMTVSYLD